MALPQRAARGRSSHGNRPRDQHQRHREFRRQQLRGRPFSGEGAEPQRQLHGDQGFSHRQDGLRIPAEPRRAGRRRLYAVHVPHHRGVSIRAVRREPIRILDVRRQRRPARRMVSLVLLGFLRAGQLAGGSQTAGHRRSPLRQILRAVGRSELQAPLFAELPFAQRRFRAAPWPRMVHRLENRAARQFRHFL